MSYSNIKLLDDYLSYNSKLNHSEIKPSFAIKPAEAKPTKPKGIDIVCSRCKHQWLFVPFKENRIKNYAQCAICKKSNKIPAR